MDVMTVNRPPMAAVHSDVELSGRPSSSTTAGDANITLWQFLLELLVSGEHKNLIDWTQNHRGEFKLVDAEAVAQLWGRRKGKRAMNYDKLSRALRYYYEKDIIKKVVGQKFVYRFVAPESNDSINYNQFAQSVALRSPTTKAATFPEPLKASPARSESIDTEIVVKKEFPGSQPCTPVLSGFVPPAVSTNSFTPLTVPSSDYASLNVTGINNSTNDTPSPTDSSSYCSPNSVCSSSGNPTSLPQSTTSPQKDQSRPTSTESNDSPRKRKALSPAPQAKRQKPQKPVPLNLSATQYLTPTLPYAGLSPMQIMSQMSPFAFPSQHLAFCALASAASLNSPLHASLISPSPYSRSPLSTPKAPAVFQFPTVPTDIPVTMSSLANFLSPNIISAGLSNNTSVFKFPDCLKTPTLPKPSPVVNSDL